MFNTEINDSALLAPTELSNDELDLVLGGDGTSGLQQDTQQAGAAAAPSIDIHVNASVTLDLNHSVDTATDAAANVVNTTVDALGSSEVVPAIDHALAQGVEAFGNGFEAIGNAFSEAVETVGQAFDAIGDYISGSGS